jgi:RND family efflux transporter MFP subunit
MQAVESVDIRARVRGYIDSVNFEAGQIVKEDHILFEIDPRPFQAELKSAQSQVAQWQAKLTRAEADVKRYRDLLPKGAASEQDLDRAAADAEEARAMIRAGEAAVDRANLDLEYAKVKAPIAGKIGRALVTKGNLVGEESLLTTLVSVDPIYAYFRVNERDLLTYMEQARKQGSIRQTAKEAKVQVSLGLANDVNKFPYSGVVDFADNKVDRVTGTVEVRAVLENPSGMFQSGFFFTVRVPLGEKAKALLIPDRAIGTDQGLRYALVVKEDKTVEQRILKIGRRHGNLRQIEEGLGPQEWIIVNGMQRTRPGGTVDPKQAPIRGEASTGPATGSGADVSQAQPVPASAEAAPAPQPGEKASR